MQEFHKTPFILMTNATTTCSYSNPMVLTGDNLNPASSGEIVISVFLVIILLTILYSFFWFSVKGVKIRQ
jgi:hypothetical protein